MNETTYSLDFTVSSSAVCVRCGSNYADVAVLAENGSKDAVCRPCVRVKDGEAGGRCDCTKGLIGVHYGCPVHDPRPRSEPRIVAECWTCFTRERMIDMGNDSNIAGNLVPLSLTAVEVGYHKAAHHDVR